MKFSTTINPNENVLQGMFFALPSLIVSIVLTFVFSEIGLIASIGTFISCMAALKLYEKGAGGLPIKGRWLFLLLIVASIAVSCLTLVAIDLIKAYDIADARYGAPIMAKLPFVLDNLFSGRVLSAESKNLFLIVIFGLLGCVRTLRYIFTSHKVHKTAVQAQSPVSHQ